METANIVLALGGDAGNQISKFNVTAAEIAVLLQIHGEDAISDIEPIGTVERSHREERQRLMGIYGMAKDADQRGIVEQLFPGVAARVFEKLIELDLPEEFFKATARTNANSPAPAPVVEAAPPAPTAPVKPLTKAQQKAAEKAAKKAAEEAAKKAAAEPTATDSEDAEDDGIDDMTDEHAKSGVLD